MSQLEVGQIVISNGRIGKIIETKVETVLPKWGRARNALHYRVLYSSGRTAWRRWGVRAYHADTDQRRAERAVTRAEQQLRRAKANIEKARQRAVIARDFEFTKIMKQVDRREKRNGRKAAA